MKFIIAENSTDIGWKIEYNNLNLNMQKGECK